MWPQGEDGLSLENRKKPVSKNVFCGNRWMPRLRSGIRENIKGLKLHLKARQADGQLTSFKQSHRPAQRRRLSPLSFPADSSKVADPPICRRRKVLPTSTLSPCASSIPSGVTIHPPPISRLESKTKAERYWRKRTFPGLLVYSYPGA